MEAAVQVKNLRKVFGDFVAVDDLSFEVRRGEVFGFLGPNGAGKSTTIRILCGIILPTSGSGSVNGLDILFQSEKIKENIGYMSQKFSLYEDLTVIENIELYAGIYCVSKKKLQQRKNWILEMANLADRAKSLTGELATGFKQRLALGCSMIHEPSVLFLDEPTSGVDPLSRRNFWDLIYEIAGNGVTVFVTTHYMDEAEHCDRLGLIYRGKLISLGHPKEIKAQKDGKRLFEVRGEPLMKALEILRKTECVKNVSLFGAGFHVVSESQNAVSEISASLREAGLSESQVIEVIPTLEDAFVAMIEKADKLEKQ